MNISWQNFIQFSLGFGMLVATPIFMGFDTGSSQWILNSAAVGVISLCQIILAFELKQKPAAFGSRIWEMLFYFAAVVVIFVAKEFNLPMNWYLLGIWFGVVGFALSQLYLDKVKQGVQSLKSSGVRARDKLRDVRDSTFFPRANTQNASNAGGASHGGASSGKGTGDDKRDRRDNEDEKSRSRANTPQPAAAN